MWSPTASHIWRPKLLCLSRCDRVARCVEVTEVEHRERAAGQVLGRTRRRCVARATASCWLTTLAPCKLTEIRVPAWDQRSVTCPLGDHPGQPTSLAWFPCTRTVAMCCSLWQARLTSPVGCRVGAAAISRLPCGCLSTPR